MESGEDINGAADAPPVTSAHAEQWKATIARASKAVVVIKSTGTRAFDTEVAGSGYATGFVVDTERGLILTNRHVQKPGPSSAEAIFGSREEVALTPVYYDPIHDFAIFRFSPASLAFSELVALELAPEALHCGLEVRLIGNDSGERQSVLSATIARLDRDAPHYSSAGYNDFNIHYVQAASGSKGGSSGSPVIDIAGRVVALNAGSKTKSSAAYYLPLERVTRALALIRQAVPPALAEGAALASPALALVPRGGLLATFLLKGFDDCRRLGVRRETEVMARASGGPAGASACQGMLVVDSVLPGGPAFASGLAPGDVLVALQGRFVSSFTELEAVIDDSVGQAVQLTVERGGVTLHFQPVPADLHSPAVTPSRYLALWDGIFHTISYQQARNVHSPLDCGGVFVAAPGYIIGSAGCPRAAVITSLGGTQTRTLEDFATAAAACVPDSRVCLKFFTFGERHRSHTILLHVYSSWFEPATWHARDDCSGSWTATPVALPSPPPPQSPPTEPMEEAEVAVVAEPPAKRARPAFSLSAAASLLIPHSFRPLAAAEPPPPPAAAMAAVVPPIVNGSEELSVTPSLVMLAVTIPPYALLDGVVTSAYRGTGLVVHWTGSGSGLILTDRNTVPVGSADVEASFAAHPSETKARVVFQHPTHNFAILSFCGASLPPAARAAIRSAQLEQPTSPALRAGDALRLVALSANMRPVSRLSRVTDVLAVCIPIVADVPRFRAVNQEVVLLDDDLGANTQGVLCRPDGAVAALWSSFSKRVGKDDDRQFLAGIAVPCFAAEVEAAVGRLASGAPPPPVRLLDVELVGLLLSKAASHGLSERWLAEMAAADPARRQVLKVAGSPVTSPARGLLQEGDILLQLNGAAITSCPGVDAAVAAHIATADADAPMRVLLWRDGAELELPVPLASASAVGSDRVVVWAGSQLQDTHRAVLELGFLPPGGGVFVSRWHHGSPSHRYGLYATAWITKVGETPTPDLHSFLAAVSSNPHRGAVRITSVSLAGKAKVLTLKTDERFWPTWETRRMPGGAWVRIDHPLKEASLAEAARL